MSPGSTGRTSPTSRRRSIRRPRPLRWVVERPDLGGVRDHGEARQDSTLHELERGPAAGRDVLEAARGAERLEDPGRVAAGRDVEAGDPGETPEHLARPPGEPGILGEPEGAVPEDGLRAAEHLKERSTGRWSDVERPSSRR